MKSTRRIDPLQAATLRRTWLSAIRRPFLHLGRRVREAIYTSKLDIIDLNEIGLESFVSELSRNWLSYVPSAAEHGIKRVYKDAQPFRPRNLFQDSERLFIHLVKTKPNWIRKKNFIDRYLLRESISLANEMKSRVEKTMANTVFSPRDIAWQQVRKQFEIVVNKTMTEADTQLTRVHAESQLEALRELGFDKLRIGVEWTINENACNLCQPLAGIVVTIDEAEGMIPRHPNCRCVWLPADEESEHEGQIRDPQDIRDAIRESREEDENEYFEHWNPKIRRRKPL